MHPDPRVLRIADYTYKLPDERIARYPLPQRDSSKLLVYRAGSIAEDAFRNLPAYLPVGSTLVLNTAKVVRARMLFYKPTGGAIELFCLEPHPQYSDITTAMAHTGEVQWQCLVGGAAKWKAGTALRATIGEMEVSAEMISRNASDFTIRFSWTPADLSFAEVLSIVGQVPLPPYIGRSAEQADESRYQTFFAQHEGSVAAPTASLHFTPAVMERLGERDVSVANVTLHVGAGTFMPVKSEVAGGHTMHREWIDVSAETVTQLIDAVGGQVIAGGTTALRTLESLYWLGRRVAEKPQMDLKDVGVDQWEPYDHPSDMPTKDALVALSNWMRRRDVERLITRTGILIAPGYRFRVADGLITNFHQPQSTLLLLVAAFVGEDWGRIYDYALGHGFRFLSYGDASLLWRSRD